MDRDDELHQQSAEEDEHWHCSIYHLHVYSFKKIQIESCVSYHIGSETENKTCPVESLPYRSVLLLEQLAGATTVPLKST